MVAQSVLEVVGTGAVLVGGRLVYPGLAAGLEVWLEPCNTEKGEYDYYECTNSYKNRELGEDLW